MNNKEVKEEKKVETPIKEEPKKEKKNIFNKENEKIKKLEEQNALLTDKLMRISAEMQNMQRHNSEDREKLIKYDGEKVIKSFLPILDNFEHAIKMDDNNLDDEVSKFLNGFKMIYTNMIDILKNLEVSEVDCLHKEFNDNSMHAVLVDNDENYDNNVVLDVLQKGYMYKDKLLRPAMVKVNNKESD